jgi:hypothetical protein
MILKMMVVYKRRDSTLSCLGERFSII